MRLMNGARQGSGHVLQRQAHHRPHARTTTAATARAGIFGTTYMAVTTDVTRGVLGEPGRALRASCSTAARTSRRFFGSSSSCIRPAATSSSLLGLVQMMWDRTEPDGYVPYIVDEQPPRHARAPGAHPRRHRRLPGDAARRARHRARRRGAEPLARQPRDLRHPRRARAPSRARPSSSGAWASTPRPRPTPRPTTSCPTNAPPLCGDPHDQLRIQPSSIAAGDPVLQHGHGGADLRRRARAWAR